MSRSAQGDGQIVDEAGLAEALGAPRFLLFKHSFRCPISTRARHAYEAFRAASPKVPTGWIDVVRHRALSQRAAEATGVRHESPQVLWLRSGVPAWHASHHAITEAALEQAVFQRHGEADVVT